jgi:hypothetical protein
MIQNLELLVVATSFLALWALLRLAWRVQERRQLSIARQIALTDAIHRELGAAAAPEVTRGWNGAWTVRMAVPLDRENLVGALTRIAHDFFSGLDGTTAPRLRILLTERQPAARLPLPGSASRELRFPAPSPVGERAG